MMKEYNNIPFTQISGTKAHLVFCLLIGIPLYLLLLPYAKKLMPNDEEQLALAYTLYFLVGVYTGRYLSVIWTSSNKYLPSRLYTILISIILVSIGWLFLHVQFPLQDKMVLNLLLSGLPISILSLTIGILVKLTRTMIKIQLQEARATAEQSLSELHLLQSQLSPHFLFNTLNNLYGISITDHEKIPALLLKLSDLLRYSVYDGKEMFVSLKDEIAYIKNYIDFEKLRVGERLALNMVIEEESNPAIKIAPMLLIVFIENAFKYAKNTMDEKIQIDIVIKIVGDAILFIVKNSYNKDGHCNENNPVKGNSGLGLANVSKRLKLLYAGEHDIKIDNEEGFYCVTLQLKIK